MKPQRLSSKDYDELLKIMRRWPQPYVGIVAKLIGHLSWQFDEIKRLKERLDKLEQPELLNEEQKLLQAFPGSQIKKESDPLPTTRESRQLEKYPLPKRLRWYQLNNDKEGWAQTLKWNNLTEDHALEMIKDVK